MFLTCCVACCGVSCAWSSLRTVVKGLVSLVADCGRSMSACDLPDREVIPAEGSGGVYEVSGLRRVWLRCRAGARTGVATAASCTLNRRVVGQHVHRSVVKVDAASLTLSRRGAGQHVRRSVVKVGRCAYGSAAVPGARTVSAAVQVHGRLLPLPRVEPCNRRVVGQRVRRSAVKVGRVPDELVVMAR